MTIELFQIRDYDFLKEFLSNSPSKQLIISNVFQAKSAFKYLVFNSKIIVIVDKDDNGIKKMFSILAPEPNGKSRSSTIIAIYLDDQFFKNSVALTDMVFDDIKPKYKMIVQDNPQLELILSKFGFIKECTVDHKKLNCSIYSYDGD